MSQTPLLKQLIDAFTCLPGVGRKSAQRMAYHLLERNRQGGQWLSKQLAEAMEKVGHCQQCRNFTEQALCELCANPKRNQQLMCIVESPADVSAIEHSGSFSGIYFVLMGHLSPLDGIGPEDLGFDLLLKTIKQQSVSEVIIATGSTIEGEATAHYINDILRPININITRIAQGVPMGGELEYIDANTLARSIAERRAVDY